MAARVLAQVRSKQGQRLEEIGRALRTDTAVLKKPIAQLLAAKKLKTKGRKRGTKYFAGGRGRAASKPRRKAKAQTRRRAKRARKVSREKTGRRAVGVAVPSVQPGTAA